jgi:hypothetical protein
MTAASGSWHRFAAGNRVLVLTALFSACTLLYYFGQVVDYFGWQALRWNFFYEVHDTQRLFFLVPVSYACYYFGFKQALIVIAAALAVFLPRAILMSPFPNAVVRALFFAVFTGALCWFIRLGRSRLQPSAGAASSGATGERQRSEDGLFTIGDLEADLSRRLVKRRGEIVRLTPKEYDLLFLFVTPGRP